MTLSKPNLSRQSRPMRPGQIANLIEAVIRFLDHGDVARLKVLPTDQASRGGTVMKFEP